ncbi:MAG: response regulator [Saccharofermentanaceae bacterium]|nr:response regulator [Saccharofermentanaceae bacterium]
MAKWVMVVDDDTANLKMAGHILSRNNMRVTALKSGQALMDYIPEKGFPDLILLDIKMPGIDGFETLKLLREYEKSVNAETTPVIFLTADEDTNTETRGFEMGVSDFVRKPFNPDVLMRRIDNVMSSRSEVKNLKSEASIDKLTGLLNKGASEAALTRVCSNTTGCLMMIDLDSFKLVNDIYGHDMGDKVLYGFAQIIRSAVPEGSTCGRLGGDEFVAFAKDVITDQTVAEISEKLNRGVLAMAKDLMGEDMDIPLGASIGAIYVPRHGNDYNALIMLADKSLYSVKKNGKHGYSLYCADSFDDEDDSALPDIHSISEILGERSIPDVALQLDKGSFSPVYRYIMRYIIRNRISACKVLFTLTPAEGTDTEEYIRLLDEFGNHIRQSLRKSDILMRNRKNQYFVFLTDIREDSTRKVIMHIIGSWKDRMGGSLNVSYEEEFLGNEYEKKINKKRERHVIIVDDDAMNLQVAGKILSSGGIRVTALKSGKALLSFIEECEKVPDLILLDVKMPEMDGFETLRRLRMISSSVSKIPVMFLTADESSGAESKGLALGAMDFLRKPFVPEILLLRVQHMIELVTLENQLSYEVQRKTQENRQLLVHVVESLAAAIDTKDIYTRGHSGRVADYARKIAQKVGYSELRQEEVYMMGLLHDVGKIGVPNSIINKDTKLTDEEFAVIKKHPGMGAQILENIKEDPELTIAARYHHERFDGRGYPDGISGFDIPEAARIIAVADAYDAMSSDRSYRKRLPDERIIGELTDGKGTQFDPKFADVMISIIKEEAGSARKEGADE